MTEFTLKLTPQEFAVVWASLGKQPAEAVYTVMQKVQAQVNAQEAASDAARSER